MLSLPADHGVDRPEPIVVMRSEDGGLDVLEEDRTYRLPPGDLRALLFFGNRVRLNEGGAASETAAAWPGPDRRWICFAIEGTRYLIHRSRLVWVARGDVPADRLVPAGVR